MYFVLIITATRTVAWFPRPDDHGKHTETRRIKLILELQPVDKLKK